MERYLGLDVHRDSCTFCVLSEAGKHVQRQVVEWNSRPPGGRTVRAGTFWLQEPLGDGHECWNASKLLCVNLPRDPKYCKLFWVGSAPFCSATQADCTRQEAEFIAYGTSGSSHLCWSGNKLLCAVPSERGRCG